MRFIDFFRSYVHEAELYCDLLVERDQEIECLAEFRSRHACGANGTFVLDDIHSDLSHRRLHLIAMARRANIVLRQFSCRKLLPEALTSALHLSHDEYAQQWLAAFPIVRSFLGRLETVERGCFGERNCHHCGHRFSSVGWVGACPECRGLSVLREDGECVDFERSPCRSAFELVWKKPRMLAFVRRPIRCQVDAVTALIRVGEWYVQSFKDYQNLKQEVDRIREQARKLRARVTPSMRFVHVDMELRQVVLALPGLIDQVVSPEGETKVLAQSLVQALAEKIRLYPHLESTPDYVVAEGEEVRAWFSDWRYLRPLLADQWPRMSVMLDRSLAELQQAADPPGELSSGIVV